MQEQPTYLVHSAKGTSWSKKNHKYIKKIDGKYYYGTEAQLNAVEHLNETSKDLDKEAYQAYSQYKKDHKEADKWQKEYEKNIERAKRFDQENKNPALNYANQKAKEKYQNRASEANANTATYVEKYKKSEKIAKEKTERSKVLKNKMSEVTVSAQVKNWVNNLFKKK